MLTCFRQKHLQLHNSTFPRSNSRFKHKAVASHPQRLCRIQRIFLMSVSVSCDTPDHSAISTSSFCFRHNHVLYHPSNFWRFVNSLILSLYFRSNPFQVSSVRPKLTHLLHILKSPTSFYSSSLSPHNYFLPSQFPYRTLNTLVFIALHHLHVHLFITTPPTYLSVLMYSRRCRSRQSLVCSVIFVMRNVQFCYIRRTGSKLFPGRQVIRKKSC